MLPILFTLALLTDTTPGPRRPYWQQEVQYDITARLDEAAGVLAGHQRMRYVNRSPDTLRTIAFHLHLNAFRPGSRWAAADSAEGRRRFNDLKDPAYAFNHVRDVRVGGVPVEATWPFAPDSTIVRFALPRPLAPGDSTVVDLDWDARPSTTWRRQGRQGRHYDFAHWYPKVVVYDRHGWEEQPLYPAGEFYGEFATYRVALDVPADQVLAATGVPVCGDPGWERANRLARPVEYGRDAYGARPGAVEARRGDRTACSWLQGDVLPRVDRGEPGRKTVLWYAEQVHHFALSMDPEYRYEGGRFGNVLVHVLYRPGDEKGWGGGVAVKRTEVALAWLDQLYGPFGWPQVTNIHRLEGGGTEFPMMIHDGSASQGLIVHELGHNYTMGLLANNEWREGWLDEGFTSFNTSLFFEAQGAKGTYEGNEEQILDFDLSGQSEPASLRAQDYKDFLSYNVSIYSRGELFFQELRDAVGDAAMRRILRTFYERWKFRHVDEQAFREVAEEVSGRDLSGFFAQWLHGTVLTDYAVGKVKVRRAADGGYLTQVEVRRKGEGRHPVEVAVFAQGDTATLRAVGDAPSERLEFRTRTRPVAVRVDPRVRAHDWNMLNNTRVLRPKVADLLLGNPPGRRTELYLDPWFSRRERRDRVTQGWMPVAWYNDVGGVTLGLRARDNYLGRFEENVFLLTRSVGAPDIEGVERWDAFVRLRNPVWLRATNWSQAFEGFRTEGRFGGRAEFTWRRREHLAFGPEWHHTAELRLVGVDDGRYLDPGQYDHLGIAELRLETGVTTRAGAWALAGRVSVGGGLAWSKDGLESAAGRPLDPFYGRAFLEASARRPVGKRWTVGGRFFGGIARGDRNDVAKQRQFYLGGSDPIEQLGNPFLRTPGALLAGRDVNYQAPGGGNVRAVDARVSAPALVALTAELERAFVERPRARLFNRVAVGAFGDVARAFGDAPEPATGAPVRWVGDAGLGLRIGHRLGQTPFQTRFDVPVWLSAPALGRNGKGTGDRFAFRWVASVQAAF